MRRRVRSALVALALLTLATPSLAGPAQGPTRVEIHPSGRNAPKTLVAMLYRPEGQGPFPAVVGLHGCNGLWSTKNSTALNPREADWGARLAALGYVVLFPDSYGSRGVGAQCRVADRAVEPYRERVADAKAALAYLQGQPFVKAESVVLLGWSNGGSTVLYAVRPQDRGADARPDFRAAIAFYPGCRSPYADGRWRTRMPLAILIGEADDWTPVGPCRDLAALDKTAVRLTTYPGAFHDFDNPSAAVHEVRGLAFTAGGNGVAHAGLDPAARADALARVPALLSEILK
ncbi:MAG: dienelactone hydrolase family protein [Bauldia sp.]